MRWQVASKFCHAAWRRELSRHNLDVKSISLQKPFTKKNYSKCNVKKYFILDDFRLSSKYNSFLENREFGGNPLSWINKTVLNKKANLLNKIVVIFQNIMIILESWKIFFFMNILSFRKYSQRTTWNPIPNLRELCQYLTTIMSL